MFMFMSFVLCFFCYFLSTYLTISVQFCFKFFKIGENLKNVSFLSKKYLVNAASLRAEYPLCLWVSRDIHTFLKAIICLWWGLMSHAVRRLPQETKIYLLKSQIQHPHSRFNIGLVVRKLFDKIGPKNLRTLGKKILRIFLNLPYIYHLLTQERKRDY